MLELQFAQEGNVPLIGGSYFINFRASRVSGHTNVGTIGIVLRLMLRFMISLSDDVRALASVMNQPARKKLITGIQRGV